MKISKLSTALLIGLGGLIGITKDLGASEIGAGGMQIVRQSSTTQVGQTFELELQLVTFLACLGLLANEL